MQHDIDQIKAAVSEMSALVERALRDAVAALLRRRPAAGAARSSCATGSWTSKELELDRLCLEFLVRQQPVGRTVCGMAYAAIRISLELERMGDYAESIARQALRAGRVRRSTRRASATRRWRT
ncbi:MAG: hypothetical protein M0C28_23225 [Candidatus Moduliflexus flocculans]|nr:hypothetical protein [Candidatus Moduliflexus flocculans]